MKKYLDKLASDKFWNILFITSIIIPFIFALKPIFQGTIPFWYDPARDMLLGLDNLQKPTLIGPPSGIPNVFYGPYWIWLISLALTISKDPRFVTFFVETLPYFIIVPIVLSKFTKLLSKPVVIMFFLVFILSFNYKFFLWNPHPAPLLYLCFIYVLMKADFSSLKKINLFFIGLSGFILGLVMNFHLSFGLGLMVSSGFVFIIEFLVNIKEYRKHLGKNIVTRLVVMMIFFAGLGSAFIPTFLFEMRHGFHQVEAFIYTLRKAVLENSSVVGQVGLTKTQIIQGFFGRLGTIFQIPNELAMALYGFILFVIFLAIKNKKLVFSKSELKLVVILLVQMAVVLYVYISSKNPVWDYHFIGVEVMLLLLWGLSAKKIKAIRYLMALFTLWVVIHSVYSFIKDFNYKVDYACYTTKRTVVDQIYEDAKGHEFNRLAYDPAIYTYDYDYLFKWLGPKNGYTPVVNEITNPANPTYLIIQDKKPSVRADFINYKTPNKEYKTVRQWESPDGTLIVKRIRK